MRITDFVKPGRISGAQIEATEQLLAAKESVIYALTGNCKTGHSDSEHIIVLTGYRLLFVDCTVTPLQYDAFFLGDCVGLGDISNGTQDIVCEGKRVTVRAPKDQLQALTSKMLAAVEAYPNQAPIQFPTPSATDQDT